MYPHATLLAGNRPRPIYRTQTSFASTATLTKPSGLEVGDLVVIVVPVSASDNIQTSGGATWAKIGITFGGSPANGALFWKVLNATDVDPAHDWVTAGGALFSGFAHRYTGNGASALTQKRANLLGSSVSNTAIGFTPAGGHRGLIALAIVPTEARAITLSGGPTTRSSSAAAPSHAYGDQLAGYAGGNVVATYPFSAGCTLNLYEIT